MKMYACVPELDNADVDYARNKEHDKEREEKVGGSWVGVVV